MAQIPTGLVSHSRKVCSLYKRALRNLEVYFVDRAEFRYEAILLRQRFEENKNIPDARLAKKLLLDGEEELFQNANATPFQFDHSPGGLCHERYPIISDSVMDFWDPVEKARYPKYFAKREELKKEYVQLYIKMYGSPLEKVKEDQDSSETDK